MSDSSPTSLSQPDGPPPSRLGWMLSLAVFAFVFGGHTGRRIPGGPFLSITGDILPMIAACTVIKYCFRLLRNRPVGVKLLSLLLICAATVAASYVMIDVYSFRYLPYARGAGLGI